MGHVEHNLGQKIFFSSWFSQHSEIIYEVGHKTLAIESPAPLLNAIVVCHQNCIIFLWIFHHEDTLAPSQSPDVLMANQNRWNPIGYRGVVPRVWNFTPLISVLYSTVYCPFKKINQFMIWLRDELWYDRALFERSDTTLTEQKSVYFLTFLKLQRLFHELMNQYQACLYLSECIFHCGFKSGHDNPQFRHF